MEKLKNGYLYTQFDVNAVSGKTFGYVLFDGDKLKRLCIHDRYGNALEVEGVAKDYLKNFNRRKFITVETNGVYRIHTKNYCSTKMRCVDITQHFVIFSSTFSGNYYRIPSENNIIYIDDKLNAELLVTEKANDPLCVYDLEKA